MTSGLGLDPAKHVGGSATLVLIVSPGTLPGFMAIEERVSACNTTGFSSMQTTGARSQRGFSYIPSTSSIRTMYSSSSSPTHHIFFPPWLQVMAFQQNPDGFSPYPWNQFAFDYFFSHRRTVQRARPGGGDCRPRR